MGKTGKTILIVLLIVLALIVGTFLLVGALWSGVLNFMLPKEIATYHSPDGEYSLVFEQMGDPAWPFGPTDVRLTLKNNNGKIIERVSTQLNDDGTNASENNIASISWNSDEVVVVLRASEMKDKEVSIAYNSRNNLPKIINGEGLSKDKADAIISVEQGYYNSHLPLFATKIELIENTEDYLLYRVYYFPFGNIERSYTREPDGNWIFNLERPLFGIS